MNIVDSLFALSTGCDLWMISQLDRSSWARRIDTYLNFQLLRSELHQTPGISPALRHVCEKSAYDAPEFSIGQAAPLMVASGELLPNVSTIQIRLQTGQEQSWVVQISRVWEKLNRPSTRIFLPEGMSADTFLKAWPLDKNDSSLHLVEGLA
jgi:hypothetical protein